MNIFIIGNPISSGGNAKNRILDLEAILKKRGHTVKAFLTRYAGDGKNMIAKLNRTIDRIIVVGGDGTLNEVINGMPDGFRIPLLHFPTGNANLLAKDLALPQDIYAATRLVEKGRIIWTDTALMNRLKFIMVAGAGLDARITEALKNVRTGQINNLSYCMPIFRALRSPVKGTPFQVSVDDRKSIAGAGVLICNVRNYAGICEIAYDADVQSGVLDIVILPGDNFISFTKYLLFSKFSKITRLKGVRYLKGKTVKITAKTLIPVEIDGDFVGRHREVAVKLLPQDLPLIVPH